METEPFKVLIIGGITKRTQLMLDVLNDKYGDRLEIIEDDGRINGSDMSFIIMDEIKKAIVDSYNPSKLERPEKPYWQKGRWV